MEDELQTICLNIGPWRKLFPAGQSELMIARALNNCINEGELVVNGYLINHEALWLVIPANTNDIDRIDAMLQDRIRKNIQLHFGKERQLQYKAKDAINHEKNNKKVDSLFTRNPFINQDLVKLITGKIIELPYYDRHLAKLKAIINRSKFCSAIDYAGVEGPVIVTLIEDEPEDGIIEELCKL